MKTEKWVAVAIALAIVYYATRPKLASESATVVAASGSSPAGVSAAQAVYNALATPAALIAPAERPDDALRYYQP